MRSPRRMTLEERSGSSSVCEAGASLRTSSPTPRWPGPQMSEPRRHPHVYPIVRESEGKLGHVDVVFEVTSQCSRTIATLHMESIDLVENRSGQYVRKFRTTTFSCVVDGCQNDIILQFCHREHQALCTAWAELLHPGALPRENERTAKLERTFESYCPACHRPLQFTLVSSDCPPSPPPSSPASNSHSRLPPSPLFVHPTTSIWEGAIFLS